MKENKSGVLQLKGQRVHSCDTQILKYVCDSFVVSNGDFMHWVFTVCLAPARHFTHVSAFTPSIILLLKYHFTNGLTEGQRSYATCGNLGSWGSNHYDTVDGCNHEARNKFIAFSLSFKSKVIFWCVLIFIFYSLMNIMFFHKYVRT